MNGNLSHDRITAIVKSNPFFADQSDAFIAELVTNLDCVEYQGGEIVMQQGEIGKHLYIVADGRLQIFRTGQDGVEKEIGEATRGHIVGEVAFLTQGPRSASVIAIRDSLLLRLDLTVFQTLFYHFAAEILPIFRASLQRMINPVRYRNHVKTIAIVSAGLSQTHKDFATRFYDFISGHAKSIVLSSEKIKDTWSANIGDIDSIREQINQLEEDHRYVIYIGDKAANEWSNLCLRQADCILVVADPSTDPHFNAVEELLYYNELFRRKNINLVFFHSQDRIPAGCTYEWVRNRYLKSFHHVRIYHPFDYLRLLRHINDVSVGLVLGGGGARGLAHIGVYRALIEHKVPIDYVGGTSFGAMVAALVAQEVVPVEMIHLGRDFFNHTSILANVTLPFLALFSGKNWVSGLKKTFGEMNVSDFPKRFFCIASNLSESRIEILDHHPIWSAIRASISLPGVVPPITNPRNELLVDGAVLNNLPIDVMREYIPNGKIIAVDVTDSPHYRGNIPDGIMTGSRFILKSLLHGKQLFRRYPKFYETVFEAILLASSVHRLTVKHEADLNLSPRLDHIGLFDFNRIDNIVELGYQSTLAYIQSNPAALSTFYELGI